MLNCLFEQMAKVCPSGLAWIAVSIASVPQAPGR